MNRRKVREVRKNGGRLLWAANVLILSLLLTIGFSLEARETLKVVTTTTTLASFFQEVGGDRVEVKSITRKNQDPHYVEAKPSYMVILRQADLFASVGLDLEVGWIGLIQRGAKNSRIQEGQPGFFEAGNHVEVIEVPEGKVDRSQGDVHPYGNPHFHLDPLQAIKAVQAVEAKLVELDPKSKEIYLKRSKDFQKRITRKIEQWKKRIEASGVKNVITYHKSLNYFIRFFGLKKIGNIEPKPGVPPTAKHIIGLIKLMKEKKARCILNESYFEDTAAKRLQKVTGAHVEIVDVEVQSYYTELIDSLVRSIEACGKGKK